MVIDVKWNSGKIRRVMTKGKIVQKIDFQELEVPIENKILKQ